MNMEIFIKDFSGTTLPRILKFGTTSDMTSCTVYKKFSHIAYQSLYLSIFLSSQINWYGLRWLPPGVCELCSLFAIYFAFSLCLCVCKLFFSFFVKDISGTTVPRILKFGTNIGYDKLNCVLKNQQHMAYWSLYLSIFLSFQ